MTEISLATLAKQYAEATVQAWHVEEGDPVEAGDDLVDLITEDGVVTIPAPVSGVLVEVYFDAGELAGPDDLLCVIEKA
ncbi:MAG: lipoyl domain-containing protein [Candidatus Omnitrophota bacterium]